MHSTDFERLNTKSRAIEEALGRLGQPITEAQAKNVAALEDCDCKEGMFALAATRRQLFAGTGLVAAVGMTAMLPRAADAKAPPGAVEYPVQADPTKEQGRMMGVDGGYGSRSQFETEVRWANPTKTAGIFAVAEQLRHDHAVRPPLRAPPRRHPEYRPGQAPPRHPRPGRPADQILARRSQALPDCVAHLFHGMLRHDRQRDHEGTEPTVQRTHGLVSTSEWTGVPLSTLLKQTGFKPGAAWVLAEGADAAVMTRSVPIDKCLSDAMIVFAQNGEAMRPEQGYPMRLFLPGWEGNISIKWLRRLEVSDKPYLHARGDVEVHRPHHHDRQGAHLHLHDGGKVRDHLPSGEMKLPGPGFYEITGLAWSGRGKIARVEVSTDGGKTWNLAALQEPVLPICQTRFRFPWIWDGSRRCSRAARPTRPVIRNRPISS